MFDPGTRVLIVDDMLIMRKQIARLLQEAGFQNIIEAQDGVAGLKALQDAKPPIGLVLADYEMPNANGLDLFRRIRGDSRLGHVPFILMALEAEQHAVVEAVKAGISTYLLKPFNLDDLKVKLQEAHQKSGAKS